MHLCHCFYFNRCVISGIVCNEQRTYILSLLININCWANINTMLCFSVILHTIAYRMQRNRTRHLLASANIHTYGIHVFKLLAHSLSALTVQRTITGMICVADTALEMNTIKSNSGECMLVSSPALSLLLLLFQAYVRLF